MKRIATFSLMILMLAAAGRAACAEPSEPEQLIQDVIGGLVDFLQNDSDYPDISVNRIEEEVENQVIPHFDLERVTRAALGSDWSNASAEQLAALQDEFNQLLTHTLSAALTHYRGQPIKYKPLPSDPDAKEVVVKTIVVLSDNDSDTMDFSMERIDGEWKAYDVAYEGVSMTKNYYAQFSSVVKVVGVDGLIKKLALKNSENKASTIASKDKS